MECSAEKTSGLVAGKTYPGRSLQVGCSTGKCGVRE